jgi:tRNA pseudouridine13 synthase
VLLKVRKRDANTEWVARSFARIAGVRPHDVGFAGLKDRHAVTVQWFTVPRTSMSPEEWTRVDVEGCQVLNAFAHARKLPRGALAGNRFAIRIRGFEGDKDALGHRLQEIRIRGVPNYFGPQRFGRDGGNLARLHQASSTWHPRERGFLLSAARSLIFNAILAERVRDGSWEQLEVGDVANLDGKGSIFPVTALDPDLVERVARLDVHPTAPLWGVDAPLTEGRVRELELQMADAFPVARDVTLQAEMRQERRALRMAVRDVVHELEGSDLNVSFRLGKGSFATTVLREFFDAALAEEGD